MPRGKPTPAPAEDTPSLIDLASVPAGESIKLSFGAGEVITHRALKRGDHIAVQVIGKLTKLGSGENAEGDVYYFATVVGEPRIITQRQAAAAIREAAQEEVQL